LEEQNGAVTDQNPQLDLPGDVFHGDHRQKEETNKTSGNTGKERGGERLSKKLEEEKGNLR